MPLIRSSLLLSTASLVCAATAQAADLPSAKAAPVEYVRICDAFGAGFFYIPGTDTCLRFSGAMRGEYTVRSNAPVDNPFARSINLAGDVYNRDQTSFRARSYLNADARTQTAYGVLRTFVSYRVTLDSTPTGPAGGGSVTPAGSLFPQKTSVFQGLDSNSAMLIDKGFIQFAGLTAGRAQSFFDFDAQSRELLTSSMANSSQTTELLAYTATFGNGFSATLSMENPSERVLADDGFFPTNLNPTATKAGYLAYAGKTIPDVVGNVRVDQAWGSAQLAAAYHDVTSLPITLPSGTTVAPKDRDGFAAIAGARVLLPFLAKGDNFTVQGTYETGAMDYINSLNYYNGLSNIYSHDLSISVPVNDGFILPNGSIGLNRGYGGYGAIQHYWSTEWNSTLFGSYVEIRNPLSAQLISGSGAGDNARIFQVGGNLLWTPVKDLIIGGEVLYSNLHLSGAAPLATGGTAANGTKIAVPADSDDVRGRLSIRRAF